jgi:hypothetical protein
MITEQQLSLKQRHYEDLSAKFEKTKYELLYSSSY